MKNNTTQNNNITNINDLQNVLGVKMEKKATTNQTLTEQGQVMKQMKEAVHKLLITDFPQYYKNIETDVIVTSKEGKHTLKRINGYYLLFAKDVEVGGKTHKGHKICQPTIYVKGGNSYSCLYYKTIGRTTFNK
tara:strand:+ start:97 stop:498 length:402 start_codon:yes stop_codon:yes gene_type:complete